MKSPFLDFLVDCWKKELADEERLKKYVPLFITEEERQQIVAIPKQ